MSKILIALIFCLNLALADNNKTDQNATNIVTITEQIKTINSQIKILKVQQKDINQTSVSASNLATLEKRKSKLLDQIPLSIMKIDVKQSDVDKFKLQKSALEKKVAKLEKQSNKTLYIQNAIEFERLKIAESYYGALINLEELFKNGAKEDSIRELIDTGLLALQTNSYVSINELKGVLGEATNKFDADFNELDLEKKTAEEILTYIKTNAGLLSSNSLLLELNLQSAIDYVNEISPKISPKINTGKIIIILITFIFFISLIHLITKITYWLISRASKASDEDGIKEQILGIVKRPITYLIIMYSLSLCVSIAFYPAPTAIKIANIFSIAYVIGFAWLVLTMLNGYGLILIGKIAQKSGRKEVVNLILKIIYFIIIIIALLMVLSRLGFDISAIIASLGIGGLAVAFAAKDIIANFFASVMLLFDNSFSQGDWIVCGDIEGTVVEIGLRKTTIRSFDNALIFVPNSKLAADPIRNWSRRKVGRRMKFTIGLTYDSVPEKILACIEDIRAMLLKHPDISKPDNGGSFKAKGSNARFRQNIVSINDLAGYKSTLRVAIDSLNDSSIDILIYCYSKTTTGNEFVMVKQDILYKIMQIVSKNGLKFAFPSQSLYVENGSELRVITDKKGDTNE